MFHSGGDTSSNCQVSDYVDKSCALVALLDLYVNSENSLGERSSLARLAVRAMRAAFSMPRGAPAPAFQSKVQWSLCPSCCVVVVNDGVDIPPAWRCESCSQTTLVDGVVPRAADSASRISPLSF